MSCVTLRCPLLLDLDQYECDSVDISDQQAKVGQINRTLLFSGSRGSPLLSLSLLPFSPHCAPSFQDYWLKCILEMLLDTFRTQIIASTGGSEASVAEFYESTRQKIVQLSGEGHPRFSVRGLLDLIQGSLRHYGFEDPWREKKRLENEIALREFKARLDEVDQIEDAEAKWTELIKGVLAGTCLHDDIA